jgi:hypothetical protein
MTGQQRSSISASNTSGQGYETSFGQETALAALMPVHYCTLLFWLTRLSSDAFTKKTLKLVFDNVIALTYRSFQPGIVQHIDPTSAVFHQPSLLILFGCDTNHRAVNPKHTG